MGALMVDLFENVESWILHSMQIVENKALTKQERIEMIRNQLDIAVDRYMAVFLLVNGFESLLHKIGTDISKIFKGIITVKELIVIIAYALYDLVIRDGTLSFLYPYDIGIIFLGLVVLKVVDARAGVAEIIAEMYKEAAEIKNMDNTLNKITEYIKELAHIYHIETITPTININALNETEIRNLLLAIKERQAAIV